ncbi:head maturation protease, ClpP-related [Aquabacter sp. CN5-332]|uniref:head maturation protease, ClpP-related n=1 Tax=Aquabacter sp. CN5-332 TaxID=3156608 RepID=UPI0032B4E208
MAAMIDDGRLRLSGDVGADWSEDHFTAADVAFCLMQVDPNVDLPVHLNSGGGYATEGAAIHALFTARPGAINIVVEGIAASAASLIAMAGDTVTMSAGSVMMIHDPSGMTFGTAADHEKTVEQLETLASGYSRIYAAKSGQSLAACRAVMKRETWMTPEQAVASGFADTASETPAEPVAAFDYRLYAHAPKRLVALAKQKNWSFEARERAKAPTSPRQQQEPTMTDKPNGGDTAAELDRLRKENAEMKAKDQDRERRDAVMALPEAKGCEDLAKALADAGLDAEKAKTALLAAPKAMASDEDAGEELPDPAFYAQSRATAAGLGGGGSPKTKAKIDRAAIFAMRAKNGG